MINQEIFKLYSTLNSKKKKYFDNKIYIYSCGITVYDYCHIGHARIFIVLDSFIRFLKFLDLSVVFVRNITDIDDKIILKALKKKKNFMYISKFYTDKMYLDIKKLKLIEPTFEPKATNFIKNIIFLIFLLKKKKYAYHGFNFDVYYDICKNYKYGILSNVNLLENKIGNRNTILNKKFDLDFVLWKSDNDYWSSPWGFGRPGWHTECAAMNLYYFNKGLDIHVGGADLVFPHHENELAHFSSVKNFNFVKIWMHIGEVKVDSVKMSKSLKNFVLIKKFLKKYNSEYLKFFFLLTHYKKVLNYSVESLNNSIKTLNNLYKILNKHNIKNLKCTIIDSFKVEFLNSLNNDFNTPKAISILFKISSIIKSYKNYSDIYLSNLNYTLKYLGNILGILKHNPSKFLKIKIKKKRKEYIKDLIFKRNQARKNKNWVLSDKIRLKLLNIGVELSDKKIIDI